MSTDPAGASLTAFAVVAVGGIGCAVAGALADRLGRTTLTIAAMAGSGLSALAVGLLFGADPLVVTLVSLVWGLTVVADSAQFSAAVSELAPTGTAGSALSLQLASGFILTAVTILGIGLLDPMDGDTWRIAFWLLALGPGRRHRRDVAPPPPARRRRRWRTATDRPAAMSDWVADLEPDAPDIVAAWRGIEAEQFLSVRARSGAGPGDGSADADRRPARRLAGGDRRPRRSAPGATRSRCPAARGTGTWPRRSATSRRRGRASCSPPGSPRPAAGRPTPRRSIPGIPGPVDADREELVRRLVQSQRIIARSAGPGRRPRVDPCPLDHPLVGRLRCGEWLLFAGVHDLMHLEQLHAIAASRRARRAAEHAPAGESPR